MKILHAPLNIAGQASEISNGLNKIGVQSDVMVFGNGPFNYPADINLRLKEKNILHKIYSVVNNVFYCLQNYDLIHFHFGLTLVPFSLDLPLYRLLKKPFVMHYHGSDIIQTDLAMHQSLLDKKALIEIFGNINNNNRRKKIQRIEKLAKKTFVVDYPLLTYSPQSIVIRQAINLDAIKYIGCNKLKKNITIIHAPTQRDIKGTSYILKTLHNLKKQYPVNISLIENLSNQEALEKYKDADIVIDDILQGPYGMFAMECMAMGKPVLAYVHDKSPYKNLPIVNVNPKTLEIELIKLINNADLRDELGKLGRDFVRQTHDNTIIASQLYKIYKEILENK